MLRHLLRELLAEAKNQKPETQTQQPKQTLNPKPKPEAVGCSFGDVIAISTEDDHLASGVGVWGLGFGVWGLGFGVWGLGFGTSPRRLMK